MPNGPSPTIGADTSSEKPPECPPGARPSEALPVAAQPFVFTSNDPFATRFAGAPDTSTLSDAVPLRPCESVTSTFTTQCPAPNVWLAVGAPCGPTRVPSPKSNAYDTTPALWPLEPEASARTASGAEPERGLTSSFVVGAWFAGGAETVAATVTVAEAVAP